MNKIVENVTIDFKNGERECFNAISLRKKGVCTGNIVNNSDNEIKFIGQGYILLDQIDKITYFSENDELRILGFLGKNKEEKE